MSRSSGSPARGPARVVRSLFALLCFSAAPLLANEMIVDHRVLQVNDLLTITVTLEDSFAAVDSLSIPMHNLVVTGEPWVSSEFAWLNGDVVRRKVFRYRARPREAGLARVGPLVLRSSDGQQQTLPAVQIEVKTDRAVASNDAAVVLRDLVAAGREPLFVVAEVDAQSVFVGQPVMVTWWLYNATAVQQWQIVSVPKLPDFWVEERAKSDSAERVYVEDALIQRMPIRRAALFPLRSGTFELPGLGIEAEVMRQRRGGPFAMFEGELLNVSFTSAPVTLQVKPIPAGPPVEAIGDLTLSCSPPLQRNGGPVVITVELKGVGNVRAASPPRMEGSVAGVLQVEGGAVTVSREEGSFAMARQWRYLLFPSASAPLEIPPLSLRTFDPWAGERKELRCGMAFVNAVVAQPPVNPPADSAEAPRRRLPLGVLVALALGLPALYFVARAILVELRVRREVRALVGDGDPDSIRQRVAAHYSIAPGESSARAEALHALHSLLTAAERGRDVAHDSTREIARRVRDVVVAFRSDRG